MFRRKKKIYELAYAGWGGHEVLLHLTAGWEPFNVVVIETDIGPQYIIWFKRLIDADKVNIHYHQIDQATPPAPDPNLMSMQTRTGTLKGCQCNCP